MLPFSVICINDADRPDGIPTSKWVKRGQKYTVIAVSKMLIQGGKLGFKLQELNIDDCFPYQFFLADRFGIPVPDQWVDSYLEKLLKEAKEEFELVPAGV